MIPMGWYSTTARITSRCLDASSISDFSFVSIGYARYGCSYSQTFVR